MADLDIIALGKELGLTGVELQNFLRDERQNRRDEVQFLWDLEEQKAKLKKEEDERAIALENLKIENVRNYNNQEGGDGAALPRSHIFQKLMPPFDEARDDMDAYLLRFERLAVARKWPETEWASALSLYLVGEALEVYARLPPSDSVNYSKLKEALLIRFRLTEDGFRDNFRQSAPKEGETAMQYLARLTTYVERWVELSKTEKKY